MPKDSLARCSLPCKALLERIASVLCEACPYSKTESQSEPIYQGRTSWTTSFEAMFLEDEGDEDM